MALNNAIDMEIQLNQLDNGVEMTDVSGDIHRMHRKFGVREAVSQFDREKLLKFLQFRAKFLQEELDEAYVALHALESLDGAQPGSNAAVVAADDFVDAMIDLCVVAAGTLDAVGVDFHTSWARVHCANISKEVGIKESRPNPLGLPDLVKPAGWVAPVHSDNIGDLSKF